MLKHLFLFHEGFFFFLVYFLSSTIRIFVEQMNACELMDFLHISFPQLFLSLPSLLEMLLFLYI